MESTALKDIRDAASVLGRTVSAGLDNKPYPLDPLYSDEEACVVLLGRRPDLHALLQIAHDTNDYTDVTQHPSLRRTEPKDAMNVWLEELRPLLTNFIRDDHLFTPWTPDATIELDPNTIAHIESLQIPAISTRPSLLIHDLGAFETNDALRTRIRGIFRKHASTLLVNASGSGKTRLSLEGLCQRWGFYFTMTQDGNRLGSADSGDKFHDSLRRAAAFEEELPSAASSAFPRALAGNVAIAEKRLGQVLLSRLSIFLMFSEIIHSDGITEAHKKKWLLLQLRPQLPGDSSPDIFVDTKACTYEIAPDEVQDLIAVIYSKLRKIWGPEFHLFYVIDEAQVVSRKYLGAFQHQGTPYPLLRQIIQSWTAKSFPHESSFVILGTDIPKDAFSNATFADTIHWSSDTGAFSDEAEHRRYVTRFLTPSYGASAAGQIFLQRVWRWCRGRHRFTDGLMQALLIDGFRAPHKLLNDYVHTTTTHRPTDYVDHEPSRYAIDTGVQELHPRWFAGSPLLESTIQKNLLHYLATTQPHRPFSEDLTSLVAAGFGRFRDQALTEVVMDEPLFVVRAARWLCESPPPEHDSLAFVAPPHTCYGLLTHRRPGATPASLSCFLVFYLTCAFENGEMLSKVFSFRKPVPKWAHQRAELVASTKSDGPLGSYAEVAHSTAGATCAASLGAVEAWLDRPDNVVPPFCLTHTTEPELIFVLRLEDGRSVRVVLRSAVTDTILQKVALRKLAGRLAPESLLREEDEDLLDTTQPNGPFIVLRAIASFPAQTHLKTIAAPAAKAPMANLNTGVFKRLTSDISAAEILDRLVTAATVGKRRREISPESEPETEPRGKKARLQSEASAAPQPSPSPPARKRKGKQRAV
ncbi:hypothetical protein C8R46DRAFT_1121324 [Mycena filopes]|nr:hypothetical protein C8R46DRAFT_1121324 [Mycena filopes]